MPVDYIAAQLQAYKEQSNEGKLLVEEIKMESPMERARREIQQELAKNEVYRAAILQHVPTFAGSGLTPEAIMTAARSMDEVYYKRGDIIIQQDDIGDGFFVLEEGSVSVTRKQNFRDNSEIPRELARLSNNAHFGDIALLTAEPRSATITVVSAEAKCLRMTKMKFDELLATSNQTVAENRKQIGQNVLDTLPLFKSMTTVNKRKLLDAMIPMTYLSSSYICRQGTTGNTFFILTDGTCRVTINQPDHSEKEVARLHAGDFFGEVALIETSNRRTANVVSVDAVSCLTLNRSDFNRLLKSLKVKLMEQQALRSSANDSNNHSDDPLAQHNNLKQQLNNSLAQKRRISCFNTHGQRDDMRIASLLKRMCSFMNIALWNSLYSRYYRDLLLDANKVNEYGKYAAFILRANDLRYDAVIAIQKQTVRILEMDCGRRTASEHAFILGLLKQRNQVRDKLCKTWPAHQFQLLCRKLKLVQAKCFRKIVEVDSKGTNAFLIVRGAVRIYSRAQSVVSEKGRGAVGQRKEEVTSRQTFFEEDLYPGDIFAESALSGIHTRIITAVAMTDVDLITIDDQDFMTAQDRASDSHMGTEEKSKFLASVPIFRHWDSYKLLRVAHVLTQAEVVKDAVLTNDQRSVSKDMFFITSGKVNIVDSLHKRHVITTLQVSDYFGESGFCNHFVKAINAKVSEHFFHIASTKVKLLVLQEQYFNLFDISTIDLIRASFLSKEAWRKERVEAMRWERAKVRKQQKIMTMEAEYLPYLRRKEEEEVDSSSVNAGARQGQANKHQLSRADLASQAALVHPLDDHLHGAISWMSTTFPSDNSNNTGSLKNLEDIPSLLNRDFDLSVVSASCRDQRTADRIHDMALQARRRPLSALLYNHQNSSDGHHHGAVSASSSSPSSSSPHSPSSHCHQEKPASAPCAPAAAANTNGTRSKATKRLSMASPQALLVEQPSIASAVSRTSIDTRFFKVNGERLEEGGQQRQNMSMKEAQRMQELKIQQERDARFTAKPPLSAAIPSLMKLTAAHNNSHSNSFQLSNSRASSASIRPMMVQTITSPNCNNPQRQQQLRSASAFGRSNNNPRTALSIDVPFSQQQQGVLRRNSVFHLTHQSQYPQQASIDGLVVRPTVAANVTMSPRAHLSRGKSSMLMRFDPDFAEQEEAAQQLAEGEKSEVRETAAAATTRTTTTSTTIFMENEMNGHEKNMNYGRNGYQSEMLPGQQRMIHISSKSNSNRDGGQGSSVRSRQLRR